LTARAGPQDRPLTAIGRVRGSGLVRLSGRGLGPVILMVAVLILVGLAVPSGEVRAAVSHRLPTALVLKAPATVELGAHPVVRVRLTSGGRPLRRQLVSVKLGAKVTQQVTTGADGWATAEITRDLSAGRYRVTATFAGTPTYWSSSSNTAVFTVKPVQLTIATVPAMPGIPLVRIGGGPILKTGPDGRLVVKMTKVGQVDLRLALPADDATRQVRLARWDDGSKDLIRRIRIPDTLNAAVGLQILHPVQFEFATPGGAPIAAADVPVVRVTDGAGNEEELTGTGSNWLRSNAINRLTTGLASSPVEYRVEAVPLGGLNVVNRGQQRFAADSPKTVKVGLLLFDLVVQGRDALLKTPFGSQVTVTDTDGSMSLIELDAGAGATMRLPRGEYRVVPGGGFGIPITTPVVLSRDQGVDVLIISALDIGLVVGVGLALVVGLIVIGRPHVLRRRRVSTDGPDDPMDGPDDPGPPVPQWPDPATARDWRSPP